MQPPLLKPSAAHNGVTAADTITFDDPWETLGEGRGKRDNWLLSYIDILTLFLTLFVVLLALQPKNEAPPVDADPGEFRFVAPEPIERKSAPPVLTVQSEPRPQREIKLAAPDLPASMDSAELITAGAEPLPPFPFLRQPDEPVAPLIYMATAALPAPADPVPSPLLTLPAADSPAPQDAADSVEEPLPLPPQKSHSRARLFMDKLAQRQLDDRVRVSEVAEGVYLEVSDNILFALGSAELKQDGTALLDELAQLLFEQSGIVSVEGHTDDRPIATSRFPSNWELSSGRATTVTRYLIGKGMDPARLRAVGYAATRPLESNLTEEGRARNRRVALIVEIPET